MLRFSFMHGGIRSSVETRLVGQCRQTLPCGVQLYVCQQESSKYFDPRTVVDMYIMQTSGTQE